MEWKEDSHYKQALNQFNIASEKLNMDENIARRLRVPKRILYASVPVRMDDEQVKVFEGYRVQHNDVLGPYKGGVRYHPDITVGEICAMSMLMTWKCALVTLPLGGAKGGVKCNPDQLSRRELQELTRRYTSEIQIIIGPDLDIPAPDLGTNEQIMAWVMDTYSMHKGYAVPGVVTGKPVRIGGSLGRYSAPGKGIVCTILEAMQHLNMKIEGATAAIQGFGQVGSVTAKTLQENGFRVIAVSDVKGGIYNEKGLDINRVLDYIKENKYVEGYKGAEAITNKELLSTKGDVLVPAALGSQITGQNASALQCRILAEGANAPTTLEADSIIEDKGIFLIPDILANAGGVIVSYFEWIQDLQNFFWVEEEINKNLEQMIKRAFREVMDFSLKHKESMRISALMIGINRISEAMLFRGLYA